MKVKKPLGLLLGLASVVPTIQAYAADNPQIVLCNVAGLIETMAGADGPLKGCNEGDTAHFQINTRLVVYSSIVARHCDLTASVVVELHPDKSNPLTHVVCRYQWKWAKHAAKQRHPDSR
jgi:hypothetical protein